MVDVLDHHGAAGREPLGHSAHHAERVARVAQQETRVGQLVPLVPERTGVAQREADVRHARLRGLRRRQRDGVGVHVDAGDVALGADQARQLDADVAAAQPTSRQRAPLASPARSSTARVPGQATRR
jgi:hypothetical protein